MPAPPLGKLELGLAIIQLVQFVWQLRLRPLTSEHLGPSVGFGVHRAEPVGQPRYECAIRNIVVLARGVRFDRPFDVGRLARRQLTC